jgi:hypothetical protein
MPRYAIKDTDNGLYWDGCYWETLDEAWLLDSFQLAESELLSVFDDEGNPNLVVVDADTGKIVHDDDSEVVLTGEIGKDRHDGQLRGSIPARGRPGSIRFDILSLSDGSESSEGATSARLLIEKRIVVQIPAEMAVPPYDGLFECVHFVFHHYDDIPQTPMAGLVRLGVPPAAFVVRRFGSLVVVNAAGDEPEEDRPQ